MASIKEAVRHRGYDSIRNEDTTEKTDQRTMEKQETVELGFFQTFNKTNVWALFLFLLTYLLNQLDRFLFGITAKSMAQEVHFGDQACMINSTYFTDSDLIGSNNTDIKCEAGAENLCLDIRNGNGSYVCKWDYNGQGLEYQLVAGPVFIVIYTFSGIFISFAADKYNRKVMLASCLVIWSTMTLLTGFVNSYWQIVILRFGLGIGEAGCTPFAASMIADYFPKQSRGLALGVYNWGIYIGYSMSYAFGNFISKANINNQGWRWSYFLAAIPGIAIAALLFLTVKDPPRQQSEPDKDADKEQNTMSVKYKAKRVFSRFFNPSVMLLLLASSIRNAAGYVISYNTQQYFTDLHQTKEQIGDYMSWIPIVGGILSVTVGGLLSDVIVKRLGLYSRVIVIIISLTLAAPFAAGTLFFLPPYAYLCQIPTYLFGEMWIGITIAVLVELVPSDIRTTGIAVYLFIITNIGGNIQLLVPVIKNYIKEMHKHDIPKYPDVNALRTALYILYPGPYLYAAFIFVFVMFLMRRDQRKAEQN
ncbi:MFS-type efflux pump MSMEG_3705-like isoform X2 [Mytilus galloprovincialis]|uniref:MFS-type efflux pump MSMEG_3705-like isoform X2 n=1 Tax=Mytilus galloprovincialis TaxID=29158 RepID=UPI003F7C3D7C